MSRFQSLTPDEARKIEEGALESYKGKVPKKVRETYQEPDVIHKVKSTFPFQIFPDELIIRKHKITLINRIGPRMSQVRDMHVPDIAQVEADVGPVFGHLHVIPKLRTEDPIIIDRLTRKEALMAREIIEDLIQGGHGTASTY